MTDSTPKQAPIVVLLVEDNPGDARLLKELLVDAVDFEHRFLHTERLSDALDTMERSPVDVLLLDLTLPDANELAGLRRVRAERPVVPIVVLTGQKDERLAIDAMKAGAQDYLVKNEADPTNVARAIRYAVERSRSEDAARKLDRAERGRAMALAERARLHSLLMQAPAAICVLMGPDLVFELANSRYLSLIGRTDVVGMPLATAVPEMVGQGFIEILRGVMETGEAFVGKEISCKLDREGDGVLEDVIFDFTYEPIRELDDDVGGVMVVATDVTERVLARKRVEEARALAALSEQRFQLLAEVIPQIVWSAAPDGSEAYLSPRWHKYTGQSGDLGLEWSFREAIHPEDYESALTQWSQAATNPSAWQMEYRLRRHDGVYRWHLARSVPHLDDKGVLLRRYGTATDIDEQRRAIRSRDDLLATVSHDLRSPLGAITMATALLRQDGAAEAKLLAMIERSAGRMNKLIEDLLDMASIESGHLSIEPKRCGVSKLVDDALESIRPTASAKAIEVESALDGEELWVECDRGRIDQVFANILGNAVKFTHRGGSVVVRARAVANRVVFSITDTGPGIEAKELAHVFERFWQAKETAKGGTGLGLAICKGIVEQHGGEIWVTSEVGAGTTFYFSLPVFVTSAP